MYLPLNEKIEYLIKCIIVQYELYRYYMNVLEENKGENKSTLSKLLGKKVESIPVNNETMALLRLTTITDYDKL